MFPGQGAQAVGMGKDLYEQFPTARELYDRADEILGFRLSRLCFEGPEEELQQTRNAQPAIAVTSLALLKVATEVSPQLLERPAFVAGHSLGEYSALVAAGAVISSDVALAASREAETLRVPLFLTMAGSHEILRRSTRYTFRTCLVAAPMYVQAIAAMVRQGGYGRVGAIVADYAWGHAIREAFERYVVPLPGLRTQVEVAPVVSPDFTPYLRRLQRLDPQLLVAAGHPPGNPTIVRQARELGLGAPVIGSVLPPELMVQRAGDAVYGRFLDYSCVDFQSPTYRRLAAQYYGATKRYFDNNAFSGYVIVKLVADAIRRTKSTDPRAIAEAIRTGRFIQPGYGWPLSYTPWGEMKEARPIIFSIEPGEAPGGALPGAGWYQKWLFRSAVEVYVPPE